MPEHPGIRVTAVNRASQRAFQRRVASLQANLTARMMTMVALWTVSDNRCWCLGDDESAESDPVLGYAGGHMSVECSYRVS